MEKDITSLREQEDLLKHIRRSLLIVTEAPANGLINVEVSAWRDLSTSLPLVPQLSSTYTPTTLEYTKSYIVIVAPLSTLDYQLISVFHYCLVQTFAGPGYRYLARSACNRPPWASCPVTDGRPGSAHLLVQSDLPRWQRLDLRTPERVGKSDLSRRSAKT